MLDSSYVTKIPLEYFADGNRNVILALDFNRLETVPSQDTQCKDYGSTSYDQCVEDKIVNSVNESLGCALTNQM